MKAELELKEFELKSTVETLDKKRKIIEELPTKISSILSAAEEIKVLFEK